MATTLNLLHLFTMSPLAPQSSRAFRFIQPPPFKHSPDPATCSGLRFYFVDPHQRNPSSISQVPGYLMIVRKRSTFPNKHHWCFQVPSQSCIFVSGLQLYDPMIALNGFPVQKSLQPHTLGWSPNQPMSFFFSHGSALCLADARC